eukprot:6198376-Pleurochrysis_carterae.AAC.1
MPRPSYPYYDDTGDPLISIINKAIMADHIGCVNKRKGSTVDRSLVKGVYYSVSIHMGVPSYIKFERTRYESFRLHRHHWVEEMVGP